MNFSQQKWAENILGNLKKIFDSFISEKSP